MNPILDINELGQLTQYEIYDYYDEPLFLAYKNELGHYFLAKIVEENSNGSNWLFLPVSQNRFTTIRSGGMDIYSAFKQSELNYCFYISFSYSSSIPLQVDRMDCGKIPDSFLPPPGIALHLKTETLPKLSDLIHDRAIQTKRVLLNLHLEFPNNLRTEAPAGNLGEILIATQDLLNAIGQAQKEKATTRGLMSQNIISHNEMLLSGIGAGSFELELASSSFVNLLDEADVIESVSEMVNLIQIGTDGDELKKRLSELKVRAASKYLAFLNSISTSVSSTEIRWASPVADKFGEAKITKINAQIAAESIKKLEEEKISDFEVIGQLVGASLPQSEFQIETKEKKYIGKVDSSLISILSGAVINNTYKALIQEKRSLKIMTGEEETTYNLLSLTPAILEIG